MDVCALEDVSLQPMERQLIRTGIRVEIPDGYEIQVRPRSGLAYKHGIALVNSPGTIDSDYRGEIGILAINLGSEAVELKMGDRIAQLVLCPVTRIEWNLTEGLTASERGSGGFGSTGK
ncbi:MAG: Deoxyuridine 5'-triphosphate nucleotidohydrolase [Fimbriimonadaceae bacterium]|nr:Deoxyuridine 5'-triphosphate nucleotidohydrolase [Fimbriimonadaceae bacterium]